MTKSENDKQDWVEITPNLKRFWGPVPERKLWELALELLSEQEAKVVQARVKANPESEQELENIRQAISMADVLLARSRPKPAITGAARRDILDQLIDRARKSLSAIGKNLSAAGTVVVQVGEQFIEQFRLTEDGQVIPIPIISRGGMAETLAPDETDRAVAGARHLEYSTPDGDLIAVTLMCKDRLAVDLTASDKTMAGTVHAFRIVGSGKETHEEEILPDQYMRDGKVHFDNCPAEILRFVLPGGRDVLVPILSMGLS